MKKLNSQMPPVIVITVQRRTKKYLDTAVWTQLVGIAELLLQDFQETLSEGTSDEGSEGPSGDEGEYTSSDFVVSFGS